MAGNSELMDIIKKNIDNHHAKLSDTLYEKWLEIHRTGRIENRESAFHLSVIIDLKTAIAEYLESSSLAVSWQNTPEEDQNGICSILLMDFLIELAHSFHGKFKASGVLLNRLLSKKTTMSNVITSLNIPLDPKIRCVWIGGSRDSILQSQNLDVRALI